MTENATPATDPAADTDPVDEIEVTDAPIEESPPEDDLDPADRKLSEEAARYRVAARAAKTELVVAQARIAELQRAEINRAVATKLHSSDDFWIAPGVDLDQFITDGEIDFEAVNAKADEIIAARPHWKAKWPVGAPSAAVTADDGFRQASAQPTWDALLKGKTAG